MTAREMNAMLRNAMTFADVRSLLVAMREGRRRLVVIDSRIEPTDFLCDRCGLMDRVYRETWGRRCAHLDATRVAYLRSDRVEAESADVRMLWMLMEFE